MPVLINAETGLAENLPDQAAQAATQTHEVPLIDPDGNTGSAPFDKVGELMQQGYTQPTTEGLQALLKHAHFNSPAQQAITGLEGAGAGATFGLSTAAETMAGVEPKDIAARREANPGIHAIGEGVGLVGSSLLGIGEGAALEKVGQAVTEKLVGKTAAQAELEGVKLAAETALGRVGTSAAKFGIDNMLFQTGDEASKMFSEDPNQSVETAIGDIGLAGVLGATLGTGFGATSELWRIGPGKQIDKVLNSVKARTGGLPEQLKSAAGIDVPQVLEAALAGDDNAVSIVQHLQESNSHAGNKVREAVSQFRNAADEGLAKTLGSTPDEAREASEAVIGKDLQSKLTERFKTNADYLSKEYDAIEGKFETADLSAHQKADVSNRLSDLATEEGWIKSPGSPQNKLVNRVLDEMPLQENALDLKNYISNLQQSNKFGSETYYASKKIVDLLKETQESAIGAKLAEKEPLAVDNYKALKSMYKEQMNQIETINDRLKAGHYSSPKQFIENVKAMDPETVLRRLSPEGDVSTMQLLQKQYPELVQTLKQHELNKILKTVGGKTSEISSAKLFTKLDKLSPEMKGFLFTPEQAQQLEALKTLTEALPASKNPSGSAGMADKLFGPGASTALGLATGVLSHSGITGAITGILAHLLGKEGPDAARLAFLKYLSSGAPISAEGFKAMAAMAKATAKGEAALNSGVEHSMGTGGKLIKFPDAAEREMLKKQVRGVAEKPDMLMQMGGKLGHYLPDHAVNLAATTARNLQYLASYEPVVHSLSPLDGKMVASKTDEAKYNRALDIAQKPLIILDAVKNGTVTMQDMQHFRTMYPALYERMNSKLMAEVIKAKSEGKAIPYKTQIGLSMFMGENLSSSMTPTIIQGNQAVFMSMKQQQQAAPAKNLNKLDKLPSINQLPSQSRERNRSTRH